MGIELYFYGGPGVEAPGSYQFFNKHSLKPCYFDTILQNQSRPLSKYWGGGAPLAPRFLRPWDIDKASTFDLLPINPDEPRLDAIFFKL